MLDKKELLTKAREPAKRAIPLHTFYKGKVLLLPKCSIRNLSVFSVWYTPGVAEPCKAISANPSLVYEYTNKANCIPIEASQRDYANKWKVYPRVAVATAL
ncbi:MAG: hypothetical protein NPIRA03_28280 [Nitrospirales bacterium]|nr:MAG: hypothetical protein NPIRA03_28280 [Nitrospirales bacterium]